MNMVTVRTDAAALKSTAVADYLQISDFDEVTEILRSRKFVQGSHYEARKTLMKNTLIVLDGKPHLRRRNLLNNLFSESAVAELRADHLVPVIDRCVAEIAAMPRGADGKIAADLVVLVQRCVYRIAAAVAGIDGLERPEAADRMIQQVKSITAGFTVEWSKEPMDVVLARANRDQQEFRAELFEDSHRRRLSLVEKLRRNEMTREQLPRDVMTYLILHSGDGWDDDVDLRLRETCLFLSAASQTTANGFLLFVLLLEDWLKSHPEDRALIESDPNFLRRAVYESLRVAATVPARLRTATEDVTLASGRQMKAGQHVALLIIPANISNYNQFGSDPDKYNPHREVGDIAHWGLTFGSGSHTCPGRPLVTGGRSMKAQTSVDGSMVSIARRFYAAGMELDPDMPPERDPDTHYNNYARVMVKFSPSV